MSKALKNCLPFFLLFTILTIIVKDNGFFWDAVLQSSKFAHYYYENNFSSLFLPASLDAGHPPLFGIYLAAVWKVFGKTLFISHFAMLPFLLGIVWQVYRLIDYFTVERKVVVMLMVVTNAMLLGHGTLVSPDIAFLFFFLFALNGILYAKKWQIIIGTIALGWLNIRGIFAIASLAAIHWRIDRKIKVLAVFVPVFFTLLAYYGFHYLEFGWWLSTPHEGWSHHRGMANADGILRNMLVLGFRLVDFGNIALWILFAMLFFRARQVLGDRRMRLLFVIPIMILFFYAPALLLFQNPIGHRYLLPFYILFATLVGVWFVQSKLYSKVFLVIVLAVQFSGNFWVYPKKIAQGWDCTMAHLPYYGLMSEMQSYLDAQNIDFNKVGTEFPNNTSRKYIDLNEEVRGFVTKDMASSQYILYSTVFNDFSDEALEDLENNWVIEKEFCSVQICVILYKKQ